VIGGDAGRESEASPLVFFFAGTFSALAGVGATVAFFQRRAIFKAIAKLMSTAKS
jgi:hypothetical protein